MGYETTVKHKVHGVNITNTTNLVPVPLARKFHVERIIILTQLTLFMFFSSVHVLYKQIHGLTLVWWCLVRVLWLLRAIPADFYESAQEILVVMNPPVGQLVADVPNKKPAECWTYCLNRIMCDNSNNAMILIIYIYIYIYIYERQHIEYVLRQSLPE